MTLDRNSLLFMDASCLIAAAGSPTGGSNFLLSLCARGYLRAAVSQPVLLEAQRNIQSNLGVEAINRFYNLLAVIPFTLATIPDKAAFTDLEKLVNKKDVHVVAALLEVRSPFLISLDKGLCSEVNKAGIGIQAYSPGEFIRTLLPHHVDYPPARG